MKQNRFLTGADNDETFTLENASRIDALFVVYTSAAAAGNRQLRFTFTAANGTTVIYEVDAGAVQAASLVRNYLVMPWAGRETAFVVAGLTVPIPELWVPAGAKLRIRDSANIAAADTFTAMLQVDAP